MSSKFISTAIKTINSFRQSPEKSKAQFERLKEDLEEQNSKDPYIKEIANFISGLKSIAPMTPLVLNKTLSKFASEELEKLISESKNNVFLKGNALKEVVSPSYLQENPALIASDGAYDAEDILTRVIFNEEDKKKLGKDLLLDNKYSQVGMAHKVVEGENAFCLIFSENKPEDEEEEEEVGEAPAVDLTELKQAFDLFDRNHNKTVKIEEIIQAMRSMDFDETNPTLFEILNELGNKQKVVTWEQFSSHVVKRTVNPNTNEGLKTMFDLFVDNKKNKTITYDTFKKMCKELGVFNSDEELKHILSNTTVNGKEINFDDFCNYMQDI